MSALDDALKGGPKAPQMKRIRMPSLSVQVFIALGLVLLAGLFFGELMLVLQPIGDIFIGLLQMAVWPYIVVSLIGGLGRLTPAQAASLGLRGGAFTLTNRTRIMKAGSGTSTSNAARSIAATSILSRSRRMESSPPFARSGSTM